MKRKLHCLFTLLALVVANHPASAQQSTAFTYQGQLRDGGTNANGTYTLIFKLYDALTNGNQVGSALTNNSTLANGLFSVNLDFGAGVFNGNARWLDITVTNGGTAQTLSPRVQVLPTPYAQFAAVAGTVTNGAIMNAQLAASAVTSSNIATGQVVKTLNGLTDAVSLSAGSNVTLTTNGNALQISAAGGSGAALAAGNNVGLFTNNGIVQVSSFIPNLAFFRNVTNATFTVPTNVTRIMVEMWGAGGGGGAGYNDGTNYYGGGGGGAGPYTMNIFTVAPGASYLVTAPGPTSGGQSGGTTSFGALMTAGGGHGGAIGTASAGGAGGAVGTATGGLFQAGDNGQSGSYGTGGGGGGVWRGSPGSTGGNFPTSGPGGGGGGGGPGNVGNPSPGNGGNSGAVFVYY